MNVKLRNYPRKDLKGKKINKLFVLKFNGYKQEWGVRRAHWLCKCDCGNIRDISDNVLKNGQKSCGCELEEYRRWAKDNYIPSNIKPKGEASFNRLYGNYKDRAEKILKIKFELTKDEFKIITQQRCFYCNTNPQQSMCGRGKKSGVYIYNGIDRINNSIGYTIKNVVPCCGICNKAKRDMPFSEFIQWIRNLTEYAKQTDYKI